MVWMKHIGCNTPIVEYRGVAPLTGNPRLRKNDWFDKSEKHPQSKEIKCGDCEKKAFISSKFLTTCDGSPCRTQLTKTITPTG